MCFCFLKCVFKRALHSLIFHKHFSHTHILSLTHILSHTFTHIHILSHIHIFSFSHTFTHTNISHTFSFSHIRSFSLTHTHPDSLTHTFFLSYTHIHTALVIISHLLGLPLLKIVTSWCLYLSQIEMALVFFKPTRKLTVTDLISHITTLCRSELLRETKRGL